MNKVVFVVGGVRSGKSKYAVASAIESGHEVVFVATCTFHDEEMDERVRRHQQARPAAWRVVEEGVYLEDALVKSHGPAVTILVDCLGMWVANLMEIYADDASVEAAFVRLVHFLGEFKGLVIIVSNEVGCGVVPGSPSGRRFRDLLGHLNQLTAAVADEVVYMQVGIPLKLKTAKAGS